MTRLRYQFVLAVLLAVVLPVFLRWGFDWHGWMLAQQVNTALGSTAAIFFGLIALRQMEAFPGVRATSYILPIMALSFAVMLLVFFFGRIDYNRFLFPISLGIAVAWLYGVNLATSRTRRPHFLVVPGGSVDTVSTISEARWTYLDRPQLVPGPTDGVVVDLRSDLPPAWEAYIADCAVAGVRVFHVKQLRESLTGRVEIEHLSENTLGSLNPTSLYLQAKQVLDWFLAAAVLLPLLPFLALVALAIRIDSPGPVLFRQARIGFRGKEFWCYKFRTMTHDPERANDADPQLAITSDGDSRITRVGRCLRRCRIDELPQIINILLGEMSWIGPRPEAASLSRLYERELTFYRYRHIVRPGISGWAQVNQGHVSAVGEVNTKLHYDFYYIKNFSLWLDLLIVFKTFRTVLTGFGAR